METARDRLRALPRGRCAGAAPLLFLCLGSFAWAQDERITSIAQRYNQIEAQLDRAVHYLKRSEDGGSTRTDEAWLTEARDYLKVSSERRKDGQRELRETFFENGDEPMMVLVRTETPLRDGATQVDETRSYFEQLTLFRRLRKTATFPANAPLETRTTKNVAVNVDKLSDEERSGDPVVRAGVAIIERLAGAGPPERDPSAGSPGDSKRFRLIQRSTSADGRFALGFGTATQPTPWKDLENMKDEATGYQHYMSEVDGSENYIIDLSTHRILGETGCGYIGTRAHYNHRECNVSWAPRNGFLVQTFANKWQSDASVAGWIDAAKGSAATTDLLKPATQHAYEFLAARKDRAFRKFGRAFAVSVTCDEVTDDGVVEIEVTGEIPKSEESQSTFSVSERFRIRRAGDNVKLEFLSARPGPPL